MTKTKSIERLIDSAGGKNENKRFGGYKVPVWPSAKSGKPKERPLSQRGNWPFAMYSPNRWRNGKWRFIRSLPVKSPAKIILPKSILKIYFAYTQESC